MSTIYLIRHGRTAANDQHRYCGSTDLSLSEGGMEELQTRRYRLPHGGFRFLTSGMLRTEQTLRLLFGDVPHAIDREFREIDFGVFEMGRYEELKERPDYQAWLSGDNMKNIPPEGESGEQMTARVTAAFGRLCREDRDTVVITHGGVIAAILESLFADTGKNRYQWQPKPGCGYRLTVSPTEVTYAEISGTETDPV